MVEMLAKLLSKAVKGEATGLLFCVRLGPKHHAMGVAGDYKHDPAEAIAVTSRMNHRFNLMADRQQVTNDSSFFKDSR